MKNSLTIRHIMKLSLIGGSCGLLSILVGKLTSFFMNISFFMNVVIGSISFIITGVGIAISLLKIGNPALISKRKLLFCGIMGGILLGMSLSFGIIGYYFAFILFSIILSIGTKNIKIGFKLISGALSGIIVGIILNTFFAIIIYSLGKFLGKSFIINSSNILAVLSIPVILYFLNFGVLFMLRSTKNQVNNHLL